MSLLPVNGALLFSVTLHSIRKLCSHCQASKRKALHRRKSDISQSSICHFLFLRICYPHFVPLSPYKKTLSCAILEQESKIMSRPCHTDVITSCHTIVYIREKGDTHAKTHR